MKIAKSILLLILCLLLIQVLTFSFMGKQTLMNQVLRHHESFVADFPDYGTIDKIVVSNLPVSDQQGIEWAKKLKTDQIDILSTESSEANERLFNPAYFAYIAFAEFNYFSYAFIAEGENSGDYLAAWESEYVWILFKWIQINKINTGVS